MTGLPPNTRVVNDPDPPGDHDKVTSCLAVITGATPGGADPGSGTVTTQQTLNTLAAAVTNNRVLAGNGTNITLRALAVADLPLNSYWQPADDGFLGFNSDPSTAGAAGLLIATNAYLARLPIRVSTLVSNLWICVTTAGSGASTTSFLWIVSGVNGTVLAQSTAAAAQAAMVGTGWQSVAMSTPVTINPGTFPYAVVLPNLATTQPTLLRQLNTVNNSPQTPTAVSSLRWAQQAGFGTAVGTVTLASNANTAFSNIVGWS